MTKDMAMEPVHLHADNQADATIRITHFVGEAAVHYVVVNHTRRYLRI